MATKVEREIAVECLEASRDDGNDKDLDEIKSLLARSCDDEFNENILKALGKACKNHREDLVELILKHDKNIVKCRYRNGKTALAYACQENNDSIIEMLIKNGSDVNACFYGTPILMMCASEHNANLLIERGCDLLVCDNRRRSTLLHACKVGHEMIVKLVLKQGCDIDINACDSSGLTALSYACQNNQLKIVEFLIFKGADVNLGNKQQITPLMFCCQLGYADIAKLIISHGGHISVRGEYGKTPLVHAGLNGHFPILDILLSNVDNRNVICLGGETALLYSCKEVCVRFAEWLLKLDVSVNLRGKNNTTALMLSCHKGKRGESERMLNLLLDYGADVHARDDFEKTALMYACRMQNETISRMLIKYGAEIDACDSEGRTALMYACLNRCGKVVGLLCKHGADVNRRNKNGTAVLTMAPFNVEVVKPLLESGVEVEARGFKGRTLFLEACVFRNMKIMKLLLNHGHNVDVNTKDDRGITPLMVACKNGFLEIVELLLGHRADVNVQSNSGMTAIMIAAMGCNQKCIEMLLAADANLDLVTNRGMSVFTILVKQYYGHNYLRLLLESGKLLTTTGTLKDVHKNALTTIEAENLSILVEFGIFEWRWCEFQNIRNYVSFSHTALKAGICPGQMKYGHSVISPLIASFIDLSPRKENEFLTAMYYYPQDYVRLCTDKELRTKVRNSELLYEFTHTPLSLFTWSFLAVSKAISLAGHPCLRAERIYYLPIPNYFKDLLNFRKTAP